MRLSDWRESKKPGLKKAFIEKPRHEQRQSGESS
jgi:hypothetical protein